MNLIMNSDFRPILILTVPIASFYEWELIKVRGQTIIDRIPNEVTPLKDLILIDDVLNHGIFVSHLRLAVTTFNM